ncbi:MAG TPA: hypothetical protein V6C96_04410 [Vampirovibrionales bacterium]
MIKPILVRLNSSAPPHAGAALPVRAVETFFPGDTSYSRKLGAFKEWIIKNPSHPFHSEVSQFKDPNRQISKTLIRAGQQVEYRMSLYHAALERWAQAELFKAVSEQRRNKGIPMWDQFMSMFFRPMKTATS